MKTRVALVKGIYTPRLLKKALALIGAEKLIHSEDKVLIKPNCVVAKPASTGHTTDPRIVEDVIRFVKALGVEELVIGEGGASRSTEKAFEVTGIKDVARRQRIPLIDLNKEPRVEVQIPQPLRLQRVEIAERVLESTCIINVPTLKIHSMALVTLSMKNLMGAILPKSIVHGRINEKIVDLASFFKDKVKLNIIDGLVGAEVDEISGTPVKMNLIIAGSDMVAVDTVATAVMDVDAHQVKYLQLAAQQGLGISNLKEIQILGEEIDRVKQTFRLPPKFTSDS
jgi:uncharacterized protein (DUF362 family)